MGTETRTFVQTGDTARVRLPHSEVCMHMRIAGREMSVQVVMVRDRFPMAQILNADGSHFSFPVTLGEAGFYRMDDGRIYCYALTEDV